MAEFIYKGIKYVSNGNYFRNSKGHNYLKYKPATDNPSLGLVAGLEYYVNKYTTSTVELSLSHLPNTSILGTISTSTFHSGISMPGAKIRFCPNGGTLSSGSIDTEGFFQVSNLNEATASEMNLTPASNLLSRSGFTQIAWRVGSLKGAQITSWTSVNFNTSNAIIYPETEIRLIAEWKDSLIGTAQKITYIANGKSLTTQDYNFSTSDTIILNTNGLAVAKEGYTHVGWSTSSEQIVDNKNTVTDYNLDSEFICNKVNPTLYAVWTKQKYTTIRFHNGGGYEGQGDTEVSGTEVWNFPGERTSVDSGMFGKTGAPKRRGYYFNGWVNSGNRVTYPGGYPVNHWATEARVQTVRWVQAEKLTPSSSTTTKNFTHQYNGHIVTYLIEPTYYTRYIIKSNSSNQIIRVTNSRNELCPANDGSYYFSNIPQYYELEGGQTYQIEVAATSGSYSFSISAQPISRKLTANPNGGAYQEDPRSTDTKTRIFSHQFMTNKQYVGISAVKEEALESFTGGGVLTEDDYPGVPIKAGFQFSEWISTITKIIARTLSNKDIYTTDYTPQESFSVIARWTPNQCYVKFNGNGSIEGMMPEQDHLYNITKQLYSNQYKKYSIITYNSRGGAYDDNTIADKTVTITHSFKNWNTSAEGNGTSYANNANITITNQSYGHTQNLYVIWTISSTNLPTVTRAGFTFMGWYDANGVRVGGAGDTYTYQDKEIILYAHWEPIGLVQIYTDDGWKYAIPYIYDGTTWKRAMQYTYNGTTWKQGAGSGQNMTNEQLESL